MDHLTDKRLPITGTAELVGADLQQAAEAKLARSQASPGKLVRDRIPEIIRSKGLEPVVYTASSAEYGIQLREKLREEVDEFLASDNDPEELADVLEVLYALAEQTSTSRQQLEKLRADKARERGGFGGRVVWSGNRSQSVRDGDQRTFHQGRRSR